MKDYKIINEYCLFKKFNSDLVGTNYRAGKIVDESVTEHLNFTEIHPYLYSNEDTWKRIELLLNGVKKSKISNLYSPDLIINEEKKHLVYPYLEGVRLEKILKDSSEKQIPVNFDLALSIAMGIADLLEAGSSIAVAGKRSFHGFLTPDNIIIDYDGNIWIKNYGIYAYLNGTDEIRRELEIKYGAWLTPEFLRNEKSVAQSDIYHLGYIIYKMVTGNYFSYSEGENFDSKLSNITLLQDVPTTDKKFLDNMIAFFKKTLHPDPKKRFVDIRKFKEFISEYFNIEELSSVTFNIAYFMNTLYSKDMDKLKTVVKDELKYIVPSKISNNNKDNENNNHIVENLLSGLDEREKSQSKNKFFMVAIALLLVVVGFFGYTALFNNKKNIVKEKIDKVNVANVVKDMEIEKLKKKLLDQQKQTALAEQKAREAEQESLAIAKKIKEEKDAAKKKVLKKEQEKQDKIVADQKKKIAQAKVRADALKKEKDLEEKKKEQEAIIKENLRLKKETEKKTLKVGDMVTSVDQKPVPINVKITKISRKLRKKLKGDYVKAVVKVIVNENGNVSKVNFIKKTGIPEIDMELTSIVRNWTFKPAIKYGKRVSTWFTKTLIVWAL